ncbi:MAG: tRNA pseudouridine(38-40) synthase TruA [Verrucomicrobiota bacterium]
MAGFAELSGALMGIHPNDRPPQGYVRLRLLLAYDGGAFDGWQSQPSGHTVQDALELAVAHLIGERRVVHGSGRTDAGVHAMGQVAHVDVPAQRLALSAWAAALNGHLPRAVRVLQARKAPTVFHARFSATGKVYTYRLWNDRSLHPLEVGRAWHLPVELELQLVRQVAALMTGTHDFAGFAANRGKPEHSTERTIHKINVSKAGPLVRLRFEGNGFLYRMVRMLTGSMVRVAQGKADIAWLEALLRDPEGRRTSFCAPADGLYLTEVKYGRSGTPSV